MALAAVSNLAPILLDSGGISGTSATTNANDTSSASGTRGIIGSSATTNANDTSSATGTRGNIGSSATTNANDTSTATGSLKYTGTSATTNANDTASASGSVANLVSGTSATTNANDTSAATGAQTNGGTSATTNANDTSAASGLITQNITGSAAVTNNNDTSNAAGSVIYPQTSGDAPDEPEKKKYRNHRAEVRQSLLDAIDPPRIAQEMRQAVIEAPPHSAPSLQPIEESVEKLLADMQAIARKRMEQEDEEAMLLLA